MKRKRFKALILFPFFMLAITGCTKQAWYEGVKQGAANNCRIQPPSETERCLENLNKKTYEEYEKARSYPKTQ